MGSWQHDPALNYSYSLLQGTGKQQYDMGKDTVAKGLSDMAIPTDHFRKMLSGDMNEILGELGPEIDPITQQFSEIRNMISDQPRGGGKTSTLSRIPIEQIRILSNLIHGSRSDAASKLAGIAGQETNAGISQVGAGMQGIGGAADIASGGRNTDIQSSWKSFFKNMAQSAAQGAGEAAGFALMT